MARIVKWAARTVGLIITLYFIFWYAFYNVGSAFFDSHGQQITPIIVIPLGFGILVLVAYILSWRNERFGGMLFIVASIGTLIVEVVRALTARNGSNLMQLYIRDWLYLGFPLLIAGILFLISSWLSRKSS